MEHLNVIMVLSPDAKLPQAADVKLVLANVLILFFVMPFIHKNIFILPQTHIKTNV